MATTTANDWLGALRYGTTPAVARALDLPSIGGRSPAARDRTRIGALRDLDPNDPAIQLAALISLTGGVLGAYHGYKRTDSVGWAIVWSLLGSAFPVVTIPVAFAQGFAERSPEFRRT